MKQKRIIVIFVLFLVVFSIGTLLTPDRAFSEMENRNLTKAPSFSGKALAAGKFGEDVEDWLSDQILGKDLLVTAKNDAQWALGMRKLQEVYVRADGSYLTGYKEDEKQIQKNTEEINAWAARLPKQVQVTCLLVPNAIAFQMDTLPVKGAEDSQHDSLEKIRALLSERIHFVDAEQALSEHQEEKLYYLTDHHWTMKGAYYGFCALAEEMGLTPLPLSQYRESVVSREFQGSLYSKAPVSFAAKEEIVYYSNPAGQYRIRLVKEERELTDFLVEEQLEKKDKYTAFLGGNYGEMQIESNARNRERVLVLKDSYANSLLPFLADTVSELYVIDLRYYTEDVAAYVEEHDIDRVVLCYNMDFWNTDNHFIRLN